MGGVCRGRGRVLGLISGLIMGVGVVLIGLWVYI